MILMPRTESTGRLAAIYSAADVFVHPGVEETFGMTVLEANSCGTKAIVIKRSACVEAALSGMALTVPGEFEELQSAIVALSAASDAVRS